MSEEKPRRRWFQFSLRTPFVGTTLFALLLWPGPKFWQDLAQFAWVLVTGDLMPVPN